MKIREIRLQSHISVTKLAEMTGLSRRTIQDNEKRGDCLVSNAVLISNALNVTLDELCGMVPVHTLSNAMVEKEIELPVHIARLAEEHGLDLSNMLTDLLMQWLTDIVDES